MRKGSNIRLRSDGRYEARYIKGRDDKNRIIYGYCYGSSYDEAESKRNNVLTNTNIVKEMNLLILGAGSHGEEVYDLAKSIRIFNKIKFLDDFLSNEDIIGKWRDSRKLLQEYPMAIVAVGSSSLRAQCQTRLAGEGFIIPSLIHPSAIVMPRISIGPGSVVCASATIDNGAKIGKGCIISAGATIGKNSVLDDWSFVNNGEVINGEIKKS